LAAHPHAELNPLLRRRDRWWAILTSEWVILAAVMLIAVFFRFYQLTMIPAEFEYDEWAESADALDMLAHGLRIFSTLNKGRELLFSYLVMAGFKLFGPQDIVLRGIGAIAGALTVGVTYLLIREMFRRDWPQQARWLAALTSLGLAVSFWQILHIRMGRRHTLLPLLLTLSYYFLWRGFNTGRRREFIIAGLFLGGSLYTYPSARFIPVALLFFLLVDGLARWRQNGSAPALWRVHGQSLLWLGLTAALVFAPLACYFVFVAPDQFMFRANQVSVFNPQLNQGGVMGALWQSLSGNLAGLMWRGDEDPLYNIPGRPMLDPVLFAAVVVGVGAALRRFRQPAYLFALVWLVTLFLPAFLVTDRIPAFKRAIGIGPVLYLFPALAWLALGDFLRQTWRRRPQVAGALGVIIPLVVYVLVGAVTYRDYFLRWGAEHPLFQDVLMYHDIGAKMLAEGRPDELWLFPLDVRNIVRRYYRLNGFTSYAGLPPRAFIPVDEQAMFAELAAAAQSVKRVVLVKVGSGQEWQADLKNVFPFLLKKYGTFDRTYASPDFPYQLDYYRLNATDFKPAAQWQPVGVNFGGQLKLAEAAFGAASGSQPDAAQPVPSGQTAWVVLRWQVVAPVAGDYQASVRLVAPGGHIVAQADRPLINVRQRPASFWEPGEQVQDYYLLPLQPGAPPGNYQLEVLLYNPATAATIPPDRPSQLTPGAAAVAQLAVAPAVTPPQLTPAKLLHLRWRDGLWLAGSGNLPVALQPGVRFELELAWQADGAQPDNAQFNVQLVGAATPVRLLANVPVGGDYPTGHWRATEAVQQWVTAQLPPDTPPGSYQLELVSTDGAVTAALGQVQVNAGRLRQFAPPAAMQQPLAATFGDQIKLLGFDMTPAADRLTLTLYWQALNSLPQGYKVFVHVLNESGEIVTQQDQVPQAGQAPTTGWLPGEVVADGYQFSAQAIALPPGTYRLAVGLYNQITGQRLPVSGTTTDAVTLPVPVKIGG